MVNPVRGDGWQMMNRGIGGEGTQTFRKPRGQFTQSAMDLAYSVLSGTGKVFTRMGLRAGIPEAMADGPGTLYRVETVVVDDPIETFSLTEIASFLINRPRSDALTVRKLLNARLTQLLDEAAPVAELQPHQTSRQHGLWNRVTQRIIRRLTGYEDEFPVLERIEVRKAELREIRDEFRREITDNIAFYEEHLQSLSKDLELLITGRGGKEEIETVEKSIRIFRRDLEKEILNLVTWQEETDSSFLRNKVAELRKQIAWLTVLTQGLHWYSDFHDFRKVSHGKINASSTAERQERRDRALGGFQNQLNQLYVGQLRGVVPEKEVRNLEESIRRGIVRLLEATAEESP